MTEELRVRRVDAGALVALRRRVLRDDDPSRPAGTARDDDPSTLHLGGFLGDRLVVSASFYSQAAPTGPEMVSRQLRFMATDPDVQGRGYGARVLDFAEDTLREAGVEQVWAHARDTALGFYRAVGWTVVAGSEHVSVETGLPHTTVIKALGAGEATSG